jgi:hypothetical protein
MRIVSYGNREREDTKRTGFLRDFDPVSRAVFLFALYVALSLVFAPAVRADAILGTTCGNTTNEAAQEILRIAPSDPNGLDPDGNGIACDYHGTDPCPDPNYPRETPDGCQASDLPDVDYKGLCPNGTYVDGACLSSEESASATATASVAATSGASSSATNTATSTATATATATQDPAANEREDEQASSEERKAKQDEATRSEEPEDRTRSVKQTPLPETDEASNRYPVALAGITFVGLIVSGLLAARAILLWRR